MPHYISFAPFVSYSHVNDANDLSTRYSSAAHTSWSFVVAHQQQGHRTPAPVVYLRNGQALFHGIHIYVRCMDWV